MPFRVPEYAIQSVLEGLRDRLKEGTLWRGRYPVFAGVPDRVITDLQQTLRERPLRVGFVFPESDVELPMVTIMPEEEVTEQAFLGEFAIDQPEELTAVSKEVVVASATAGQTRAVLAHSDVAEGSYILYKNAVELAAVAYTLEVTTGRVLFATPLAATDKVEADYDYFSTLAGSALGEIARRQTRLFVVTPQVELTLLVAALVRRELWKEKDALEAAGLDNLAVQTVALSAWSEVFPVVAPRRELLLTYVVHQTIEREETPPRTVVVDVTET